MSASLRSSTRGVSCKLGKPTRHKWNEDLEAKFCHVFHCFPAAHSLLQRQSANWQVTFPVGIVAKSQLLYRVLQSQRLATCAEEVPPCACKYNSHMFARSQISRCYCAAEFRYFGSQVRDQNELSGGWEVQFGLDRAFRSNQTAHPFSDPGNTSMSSYVFKKLRYIQNPKRISNPIAEATPWAQDPKAAIQFNLKSATERHFPNRTGLFRFIKKKTCNITENIWKYTGILQTCCFAEYCRRAVLQGFLHLCQLRTYPELSSCQG